VTTRTLISTIQTVGDSHPNRINNLTKRTAIWVIIVVAACTVIAACTSPTPYLWVAMAATVAMSSAAFLTSRPWFRALLVNLAVIAFTLGAVEGYFFWKEPPERQMEYSESFFEADEVLGYKPASAKTITHRTYGNRELLYSVNYTINAEGLRVASPLKTAIAPTQHCVAFFGDSFTFGEGMADDQTMPYQVWNRIGHRYHTVNFGFLGYGPHQMLAAIEQGLLSSKGHCRPSHVVYQAIPTHVSRAAGLEAWDRHGPRYVMKPNGLVQLDGHFDDRSPATLQEWLRGTHHSLHPQIQTTLEASALYRTVLRSHRPVEFQDVALFSAIVGAAKKSLATAFPGAEFHVIFWDYDDDAVVGEQIQTQLRGLGVAVHAVSSILPNFPAARAEYEISPYDRHPNAQAHAVIADFVAQRLVNSSADESGH